MPPNAWGRIWGACHLQLQQQLLQLLLQMVVGRQELKGKVHHSQCHSTPKAQMSEA